MAFVARFEGGKKTLCSLKKSYKWNSFISDLKEGKKTWFV